MARMPSDSSVSTSANEYGQYSLECYAFQTRDDVVANDSPFKTRECIAGTSPQRQITPPARLAEKRQLIALISAA